jgi:hypothetical protein
MKYLITALMVAFASIAHAEAPTGIHPQAMEKSLTRCAKLHVPKNRSEEETAKLRELIEVCLLYIETFKPWGSAASENPTMQRQYKRASVGNETR